MLSRVLISWEKTAVYRFKIEGSPDQAAWSMLVDRTASTDDSSDQAYPLTGSPTARYMKITVTGLDGSSWASFFEFGVYGF